MRQRESHPVGTDASDPLRVECYVRSNVSAVSRRQITAVRDRLLRLRETPLLADVTVHQWPQPEAVAGDAADGELTRADLVREFERWTEEHGYSLRPAFRRRTVPGSLIDHDNSSEEIRVPIVGLALAPADGDGDGPTYRGVVPYTVARGTDDARTYTVDDWLTAAENATAVPVSDSDGRSNPGVQSD